MAEIVVAESVESDAGVAEGELKSRAARKRRMDLRKLRTAFNGIQKKMRRAESNESQPPGERMCPGYGMTSMCGRRKEMEDAVSILPRFCPKLGYHFFAVFDGHGCSHVAVSCKNRMHELVAVELESASAAGDDGEWKGLMERSFFNMESELLNQSGGADGVECKINCKCQPQSINCDYVGSTAVVAVLTPEKLIVANCGDSRALLCRGGVPTPLSIDHKPDRPDELQRIHEAGGRVIYWDGARVLGVLAMSRAIGDNLLKPYVISEPEVTVTERMEDDEFLILASDGLWDVVSNKMACEVVRVCLRDNRSKKTIAVAAETESNANATNNVVEIDEWNNKQGGSNKACRDAAFLLTKLAMARLSSDNVSVVVVDLRTGSCSSNSNSSSSSSSSSLLEL
ncbi:Protein phosphatase 2C [Zostera marina]|uniref:protein-serine/threonine phosphatase n=1 Tax=Zostera marina TaxID=29655 RepID=A0A0K9NZH6_ZOSMR|nr:Protein phosphatase 2C [Zostera marina]